MVAPLTSMCGGLPGGQGASGRSGGRNGGGGERGGVGGDRGGCGGAGGDGEGDVVSRAGGTGEVGTSEGRCNPGRAPNTSSGGVVVLAAEVRFCIVPPLLLEAEGSNVGWVRRGGLGSTFRLQRPCGFR